MRAFACKLAQYLSCVYGSFEPWPAFDPPSTPGFLQTTITSRSYARMPNILEIIYIHFNNKNTQAFWDLN